MDSSPENCPSLCVVLLKPNVSKGKLLSELECQCLSHHCIAVKRHHDHDNL